jgi:hypothetical protein
MRKLTDEEIDDIEWEKTLRREELAELDAENGDGFLEDLPACGPLPHPDADLVGEQVCTVHGPGILVAGRVETGVDLKQLALVELPDGQLVHAHLLAPEWP